MSVVHINNQLQLVYVSGDSISCSHASHTAQLNDPRDASTLEVRVRPSLPGTSTAIMLAAAVVLPRLRFDLRRTTY